MAAYHEFFSWLGGAARWRREARLFFWFSPCQTNNAKSRKVRKQEKICFMLFVAKGSFRNYVIWVSGANHGFYVMRLVSSGSGQAIKIPNFGLRDFWTSSKLQVEPQHLHLNRQSCEFKSKAYHQSFPPSWCRATKLKRITILYWASQRRGKQSIYYQLPVHKVAARWPPKRNILKCILVSDRIMSGEVKYLRDSSSRAFQLVIFF